MGKEKQQLNALQPPYAEDAEKSVLGMSLMGDREALDITLNLLPFPACFHKPANETIYSAIKALNSANKSVDLVTVSQYLKDTGKLDDAGGMYYLTTIISDVTTSAYHEQHCQLIYEKYILRELIRVSGEAINKVYAGDVDAFELVDQTSQTVSNIIDQVNLDEPEHISAVMTDVLMDLEEQKQKGNSLLGITTGFYSLDKVTLGWVKTDLNIIAARPAQGKTALALNLAENAAIAGTPVLLFSLEMPRKTIAKRMIAGKSHVALRNILTADISENDSQKLDNQLSYYQRLNIHIEDKTFGLEGIRRKIRRWNKKNPNGLVIIDYLQLVKTTSKGTREQEVSHISRELKEIAMELDIPVIALSQLSRKVEEKGNKKPELQHLRESGAIEQDASVIISIWWENCDDGSIKVWLCVLKNRNGQLEDVPMKFIGAIQLWTEWDDVRYDIPAGVQVNKQQQQPESDWGVPFIPDNPRAGITPNYAQHFQQNTLPYDDNF